MWTSGRSLLILPPLVGAALAACSPVQPGDGGRAPDDSSAPKAVDGAELLLPSGSAPDNVEISLRVLELEGPDGFERCSPVFAVEPVGLQLEKTASLSIPESASCPLGTTGFTRASEADRWQPTEALCDSGTCVLPIRATGHFFIGRRPIAPTTRCGEDACTAPPAPRCEGDALLRFGRASGCDADGCMYAVEREDCPGGCSDGACVCDRTETSECVGDAVYQVDRCGVRAAKVADCTDGCDAALGQCAACDQSCGDRVCGPIPGCGGSCGDCAGDAQCTDDGRCVVVECVPGASECTDDHGTRRCAAVAGAPEAAQWGARIACGPGARCEASSGECELDPTEACRAVEAMVVLDRSSSMQSSGAWTWTKKALLQSLRIRSGRNALGLRQFPSGDTCGAGDVLALGQSIKSIDGALLAPSTNAATPIAAALKDLLPYYGDRNAGQFVLLVTDGAESCGTTDEAVQAAADLYAEGVAVYVIAITEAAHIESLHPIARAGGTVRSRLVTDEVSLARVVDDIFTETRACRFEAKMATVDVPPGQRPDVRGRLHLGDPAATDFGDQADDWLVPVPLGPNQSSDGILDHAFSPDGRHLAFVGREAGATLPAALYLFTPPLMPGRNEVRRVEIPGEPAQVFGISWFSDSQRLVVRAGRADSQDLWFIDLSDGRVLKLADGPIVTHQIVPGDGAVVWIRPVPRRDNSLHWQPVPQGADVPTPIQVLEDESYSKSVTLAPNGRWLAFLCRYKKVCISDLSGGAPGPLRELFERATGIYWSSTSQHAIIFTEHGHSSLLFEPAAASGVKLLYPGTPREGGARPAHWSGDGDQVAFLIQNQAPILGVGGDSDHLRVWSLQGRSGDNSVGLTPTGSTDLVGAWAWAPAGHYLAYNSQGSLQLMRIQAGAPEMATHRTVTAQETDDLAWGPDGKRLLYVGTPHGLSRSGFHVYDIDTNTHQRVENVSLAPTFDATWSADRTWTLLHDRPVDGTVGRISVLVWGPETGGPTRLKVSAAGAYHRTAWRP